MSYGSSQASSAVRADAQHCLDMIREGRCTVERAKNALDATLAACDEGIAYIKDQLSDVDFDLPSNKYAQDYVEKERRSVLDQLGRAQSALRAAKERGDEREAFSQEQSVKDLQWRLHLVNEDAHALELDQAKLEQEKKQIEDELEGAEMDRDRLDKEGHDLYNRLAEETEVQNSELQRQADLITSKR